MAMIEYMDKDLEKALQSRRKERTEDSRGPFYRDTTAIIHSSPFRRLKHKTQVFFAPSNDHICTRMEHVLHVASIASSICRPLGLDSELAWAIGMGHDLGHTPFGHVGERIISRLSEERGLGAFEHEVNSLRVVDFLAEHGKGLNLTYAVRDGYGLVPEIKSMQFGHYTAYLCGRHLYMIDPEFNISGDDLTQLVDLYNKDHSFAADTVVLFGYSFNFGQTEAIKKNLGAIADRNRINIDIRY